MHFIFLAQVVFANFRSETLGGHQHFGVSALVFASFVTDFKIVVFDIKLLLAIVILF